ncbi:MAG: carboxypeptidase regulatory-like domain-containing protein [Candidatus Sumerlaeaceae bacterium]|nr:carboxypeptidase regulatory-like domain-containing protein [Candidatus Sumerlaeaceae bacterium]
MERDDSSETSGSRASNSQTIIHRVDTRGETKARVRPTTQAHPGVDDDLLSGSKALLLVKGRLTLENGQPATSATVELLTIYRYQNLGRQARTITSAIASADGSYRLLGSVSGTYYIKASHANGVTIFRPVQNTLQWEAGYRSGSPHRILTMDAVLPNGVPVNGRVVDDQDQPISGARIAIAPKAASPGQLSVAVDMVTTGSGEFQFSHVMQTPTYVSASAKGFPASTQSVSPPTQSLLLRLNRGTAAVSGVVLEKPSDVHSSGVVVTLTPQRARNELPLGLELPPQCESDSVGTFQLQDLAPGKYLVDARKEILRLLPTKRQARFEISIADGQTSDGMLIFVYGGHTIKGTVREEGTAATPLADVRILTGHTDDPESISTTSTAAGNYQLQGVFGNYGSTVLKAIKAGYKLRGDNRQTFDQINLNPDTLVIERDLVMVKTVSISGTVFLPDGRPASNAFVVPMIPGDFDQMDKPAAADSNGRYSLDAAPGAALRVLASATGYPPAASQSVTAADHDVDKVDIQLKPGATLRGMVQLPDGSPAEGAMVTGVITYDISGQIRMAGAGTAVSETSGSFEIKNVPGVSMKLTAAKDGYISCSEVPVSPKPGGLTDNIILKLEKGCKLAGRITNKEGKPMASLSVFVASKSGKTRTASTQSDSNGHYELENIAPGTVDINISNGSESFPFKNVQSCREDADFVITPKPPVKLTGRVVDWKTGQPLESFTVTCGSDVAIEKDPAKPGVFTVGNLPVSTCYGFTIESTGYKTLETDLVCMPGEGDSLTKTFEMGPGGRVVGRIVNAKDKSPVEGATISIRNAARNESTNIATTKSDADGGFSMDDLQPNDSRRLIVSPPSPWLTETRDIKIKQGDVTDLGEIVVGVGTIVTGRVVRMPGEVGLEKVEIEVGNDYSGGKRNATTGPGGKFEIAGLKPGRCEFRLPAYGKEPALVTDIKANSTQEITIRVGSITMRGHVTKAGQPVPSVEVGLMNLGAMSMRSAKTNEEGYYEMANVLPGRQLTGIQPQGGSRQPQLESVDIPDNAGVFDKDFVVSAASITGTVVDIKNSPVQGAKVTATAPSLLGIEELAQSKTAESGPDGRFAMEDVVPGNYSVTATKEGVGKATQAGVTINATGGNPPPLTLMLKSGGGTLVSVVLQYANGQGLQSAKCKLTNAQGASVPISEEYGANGTLTVPDLPPGQYTARIFASGYSEVTHNLKIRAGDVTRLDDVLYRTGTIIATVSDNKGKTMVGAECTLTPTDPNSIETVRTGKTTEIGVWQIIGLFPGTYTLEVRAGAKKATKTIELTEGEEEFTNVALD